MAHDSKLQLAAAIWSAFAYLVMGISMPGTSVSAGASVMAVAFLATFLRIFLMFRCSLPAARF